MTVEIKSQKSKTDSPANDAASRAPGLKDIFNIDPLQQGQALLAARKNRKKQQKRAGLYKYQSQSNIVLNIVIIILSELCSCYDFIRMYFFLI